MRCALKCLFLLALCTFVACSWPGSKDDGPAINADGSLGSKPRDFFHVESPSKISVVRLVDQDIVRKLYFDGSGSLIDLGTLPLDKIVFSTGGEYLTIVGEPGVYEFRDVVAETLPTSGVALAPSSLEFLCSANVTRATETAQFGSSARFRELQIHSKMEGYQLKAIGANSSEVLGGETAVFTKKTSALFVEYGLAGFGDLRIKLGHPHPQDSNYFTTTVSGLFCRFGDAYPTKMMASTSAKSASGWGNADNAKTNDELSATVSLGGYGSTSGSLILTGYFSDEQYALPSSATIEGIAVHCDWGHSLLAPGSGSVYVTEVRLVDSNVASGDNKGALIGSEQMIKMTFSTSTAFGGFSDSWNVAWTPEKINSTGFGVSLEFTDGSHSSPSLFVDYCKLMVFWH